MSPSRQRVVFMGSPDFAVPTLRALHRQHELVCVVSQPDRRRGRGRALAPPPVKRVALELGVDVMQPERIRRRAVRETIMAYAPDVIVVVAYGQILSPRLLLGPRLGCLNVHASLLPRYRGAAPIQWTVLRGEKLGGVTIMQMEAGLDTGPLLLAQAVELAAGETAGSLHDRLAPIGATLLLRAITGLCSGELKAAPQDDALATEAPMLSKGDGRVDFTLSATRVDCWIRGMDPWPGAFTELPPGAAGGRRERLKLHASFLGHGEGAPGEVLSADDRGLLVACGEGAVWIGELQREGRRRLPASSLLAGWPIPLGTILGR